MASTESALSTHVWKRLSGRKLVALSFLLLCLCLIVVYWAAFELGYNPLFGRSHDGRTSSFFPRMGTLDQYMPGRKGILKEEDLLQAINKLPFRMMTPSALLLEDLYFIPSSIRHAHYHSHVIHQPEKGCGMSDVSLLILVPSPPGSSHVRKAIRETWGSAAHGRQWPWRASSYPVQLVFVLGVTQDIEYQMRSWVRGPNNNMPSDTIKPQTSSNSHPVTAEELPASEHYENAGLNSSQNTRGNTVTPSHASQTDHKEGSQTMSRSAQSNLDLSSESAAGRLVRDVSGDSTGKQTENLEQLSSANKTKKSMWGVESRTVTRSERDKVSLDLELSSFHDILQFDMLDSYVNLTQKIILALQWAISTCPRVKYVLKVDQDVFVNVPLLTTFLKRYGEKNSIYGHIYANSWVEREGKWAVSSKSLPIARYPIYAAGNAYVLSKDSAVKVVELAPYFPYIPVEDAFITGILASVAKIDRVNMAGFTRWTENKPDPCEFVNDRRYVGNNLTAFDHRAIWRTLVDRGNGLCDR